MRPIESLLTLRIKGDKTGETFTFTAKNLHTLNVLYEVKTTFDLSTIHVYDAAQTLLMTATRSGMHVWYVVDGPGKPYVTIRKVHKVHGSYEVYAGDVKIHHITHHPEPKVPPALNMLLVKMRPPEGEIKANSPSENQVLATFKEGTHEEHEKHVHGFQYSEPHAPYRLEVAQGGVPSLYVLLIAIVDLINDP
eukprot:GGOE01054052.1.p1 GENE.GGOE01054052.1~~GGOE01054052.1.p1  ORF type:complete len:193 (-),score=60.78 GGOE01054052.1:133-711(-)